MLGARRGIAVLTPVLPHGNGNKMFHCLQEDALRILVLNYGKYLGKHNRAINIIYSSESTTGCSKPCS